MQFLYFPLSLLSEHNEHVYLKLQAADDGVKRFSYPAEAGKEGGNSVMQITKNFATNKLHIVENLCDKNYVFKDLINKGL